MRKTVLSLMSVAALGLAGCNAPHSSPQTGADAPTSAAHGRRGQQGRQRSERHHLGARFDPAVGQCHTGAEPGRCVGQCSRLQAAGQQNGAAGTFPQPFKLTFNPAEVKPDDLYVVQAILTDGERHYSMPLQAPVLAKGSKNDAVTIELVAEQTPGEKVLADFLAEQKLIGGMKISHGTKLEKDDSRGWQLFRQAGEVKFIREEVDYGDKGYTSTDYAYKGGKAWAIVQETKASRESKPSSIDRAGWSEDGTLVLKQHEVSGDVQALDPAAASKLQKQAVEILGMATGGKNK